MSDAGVGSKWEVIMVRYFTYAGPVLIAVNPRDPLL